VAWILALVAIAQAILWFVLGTAHSEWRSREQQKLIQKLPSKIIKALKKDEREQLTLDELEELVLELGHFTELGIVPSKCPECGNSDLETIGGTHSDPRADDPWMRITCKHCGWSRNR